MEIRLNYMLCLLLTILFTLFTSFDFGNDNIKKPLLKIAVVNSYNFQHPCTAPQNEGFRQEISRLEKFYRLSIRVFDMKTKLTNRTKEKIEYVASRIINKLESWNPHVIYTTDDNACIYVGIPLSKKYLVISSGLNKFPSDYISEYNLDPNKNKIIFISEYIRLDNVWNLFEQNNFFVNVAYIISEPEYCMSTTNYYMLKNYLKELNGHINVKIIRVQSEGELINSLKRLNEKEFGLLIPVIQKIYVEKDNTYKDKLYITKEIINLNKKHLELGGNLQFCRYGLSLCNIPDFLGMGKVSANVIYLYKTKDLIKSDVTIPKYCDIIQISNKIAVNSERIQELGLYRLLNNAKLFYKIYDRILKEKTP